MSHIVLDASVWVARLVVQDVFHTRCKEWIVSKREGGTVLVSPSLLLAEVAGVVSRRTGEPELARRSVEGIESLPGIRLIQMNSELVREASRLAAELGLRSADSIYVATAIKLGVPLATLDNEQRKRAAGVVGIEEIDA